MINARIKKIIAWLTVVVVFFGVVVLGVFSSKVSAEDAVTSYPEINDNYIKKRALYRLFRECYMSSALREGSIWYWRHNDGFDYVTTGDNPIVSDENATIFTSSKSFNVPLGFFDRGTFSCYDKDNSKSGIYQVAKISARNALNVYTNNINGRNDFYYFMGYKGEKKNINPTPGGSIAETVCYQYSYEIESGSKKAKSNKLCLNVDSNGLVINGYSEDSEEKNAYFDVVLVLSKRGEIISPTTKINSVPECREGYGVHAFFDSSSYSFMQQITTTGCLPILGVDFITTNLSEDATIDYFISYASSQFGTTVKNVQITPVYSTSTQVGSQDNDTYTFMGDRTYIANAIAYFEYLYDLDYGIYDRDTILRWSNDFTTTELYYIYMRYFKDYYGAKVVYDMCSDSNNGDNYLPIVFGTDDSGNNKKFRWCPVDNMSAIGKSSNSGLRTGSDLSTKNPKFSELLTEVRSNYSSLDIGRLPIYDKYFDTPTDGTTEPGEDGKSDKEPSCMSAGSEVAWMLCPILNLTVKGSETIYGWVEPKLYTPPQLLVDGNNNTATQQAWSVFQQIANSVFIVLFLVVIFSQLTGVGIDNYGIKKILPKLIVAAILINLSFVICQIMVDLSNIAGNGLRRLFEGIELTMPEKISFQGTEGGSFSTAWGTIKGGLLGIGLLGVLAGGIWSLRGGLVGIVLGLLMAGLSILMALLFLYVLLAARLTLIVLMTVISPVAFACYILPNTKKLFDKWLNIMKGMLLVYPICGFLVGVGDFTSRLMFATGIAASDLGATLLAMAVSVIPIFFFPTVLKNSFSAMGKFGAAFAGFGSRARKGVVGAAKKSEAYQNMQKLGAERRNRILAGRDKDGHMTDRGKRMADRAHSKWGRRLGMDRRFAARGAAAEKVFDEQATAEKMLANTLAAQGIAKAGKLSINGVNTDDELGSGFDAGTDGAYYGQKFLEAASRGDVVTMNGILQAMKASNMKQKDIDKLMRVVSNHDLIGGMSPENKAQWMRDAVQKHGIGATDMELAQFWKTGGKSNGGVLGKYGEYAANNISKSDIDVRDLGNLSGDSLAALIKAGKIDSSMAQQYLALNPNASADKKIMMGAVACEAITQSSLTGVDAAIFKKEADDLANNRVTTSSYISDGVDAINAAAGPDDAIDLKTRIASWVAPPQVRAYVSQDGSAMPVEQRQSEKNPVFVKGVGGGSAGGGGTDVPADPTEMSIDHSTPPDDFTVWTDDRGFTRFEFDSGADPIDKILGDFAGETEINSEDGRYKRGAKAGQIKRLRHSTNLDDLYPASAGTGATREIYEAEDQAVRESFDQDIELGRLKRELETRVSSMDADAAAGYLRSFQSAMRKSSTSTKADKIREIEKFLQVEGGKYQSGGHQGEISEADYALED